MAKLDLIDSPHHMLATLESCHIVSYYRELSRSVKALYLAGLASLAHRLPCFP